MAIPKATLKAFEKTNLDIAIDEFAQLENPSNADLNRVRVQADIKDKLDRYRFGATGMDEKQLEDEAHSSSRMAGYMEHTTDPRPSSLCDCHAMVSGKHKMAAPMRAVLAWCMMRIDDPRNGCGLPRTYEDRPRVPSWLKKGVPHQGLHNPSYYKWLEGKINLDDIEGLDDLIDALRKVRCFLQLGALPPEAWPKR